MGFRIKNTRFSFPGAFQRIITGDFGLEDLKEQENEDENAWFDSGEHRIPLKRLLDQYGSNIVRGLDPTQVARNRAKYGANTFDAHIARRRYEEGKKIIKSFVFGLNTLIWLCAILSLLTSAIIRFFYNGHSYDGELLFGSALILVTIISGLSFYLQEYKSAKIMESFNSLMTPHFAMVKRDYHFKELFADELVVGDIVKLKYGDIIPADIRLLEVHEFFVDNSSLTGESDPKRRSSVCTDVDPMESKNLVFASTHAVEGHAKGIVVAVGGATVMGRMVELAGNVESAAKGRSPVVAEIEDFIKSISIRSFVVGLIGFGVCLAQKFSWQDSVSFFTELIVASVPEGLNLTCTMLVVMMASKMASNHCLVKNLHALESLASSSILITDKTGTITTNKVGFPDKPFFL